MCDKFGIGGVMAFVDGRDFSARRRSGAVQGARTPSSLHEAAAVGILHQHCPLFVGRLGPELSLGPNCR